MLREGDQNQQPHRGDICKINLIGKLENGTVVEELHDYSLQVGDVEVVQGIDMVLPLMRVGELAQVAAEARFAYGSIGLKNETDNGKSIPPNATVGSQQNAMPAIPVLLNQCRSFSKIPDHLRSEPDRVQWRRRLRESSIHHPTKDWVRIEFTNWCTGAITNSFAIFICSDHKRQRGNFWYERSEFNLAIQLYRRSLEYLDDTDKYVGESSKKEEVNRNIRKDYSRIERSALLTEFYPFFVCIVHKRSIARAVGNTCESLQ